MTNLEHKSRMSTLQYALVIVVAGIDAQIILSPNALIRQAGEGTWISILAAGLLYFGAAVCMLKICQQYPGMTIMEFAPLIYGKIGGMLLIVWLFLIMLLLYCLELLGFAKVISMFMFDRTPLEVIAVGMVFICTYCAMQDWGTILRLCQLLFFTSIPMLMGIWLVSLFNFVPENLLPLWPKNWRGVAEATATAWNLYSGYEGLLFLLLPMVYRGKIQFVKTLGGAFAFVTLVNLIVIVMTVGVLTVKGAQAVPYPTIVVIRGVELPGTFIERLENYLLLAWIPIVFDTMSLMHFMIAEMFNRFFHYQDRRPWVLLLAPVFMIGGGLLELTNTYDTINQIYIWLGIGFSLVVGPLTYLYILLRRKGRRENVWPA